MSVCIIFNPTARGEKASLFREKLAHIAGECTLKPTYAAGSARPLAAEAVREGFDTIVAAGGDGTVNEVLNGIGDVPNGFASVRFGILPLGTVNVFAKELKLPETFEEGWEVIRQRKEMPMDVPLVEFMSNGQSSRRYFVQMAGAGLDARAIELVNWELKKKAGALAYIVAGIQALRGPLPDISVSNGETTLVGKLVLIGNGRFYGGRWNVFPQADLQDGVLEVSIFPRLDMEALARCGVGLLMDQLHQLGDVLSLRGKTITLQSEAPVGLEVEGDNVGHLPARFWIEAQKLRVIVP